jgi:hypothetical protein
MPCARYPCKTRLVVILLMLSGFIIATPPGHGRFSPAVVYAAQNHARATIRQSYGRLPLSFEANQGQTDARVKYLARGPGYALFLTATEAVLVLHAAPPSATATPAHDRAGAAAAAATRRGQRVPRAAPGAPSARERYALRPLVAHHHARPTTAKAAVLRLQFVGANPAVTITGREALPGTVNYFLGNDPRKWRTGIPTYRQVVYRQLYPGIDLIFYGNQRQVEYDFVVAPGADPGAIAWRFQGADRIDLNAEGDLVLTAGGGEVRLPRPRITQAAPEGTQTIAGGYVLRQGETLAGATPVVGVQVAAYDRHRPLRIDPAVRFASFLGGSQYDWGRGIAVDAAGQAYVTGETWSPDFPTVAAFQPACGGSGDAFVAKVAADGSTLLFASFLGGSNSDEGSGIAVDAAGQAYVTGLTDSPDFPTVATFQPAYGGDGDAFVAQVAADGSALLYASFLGGSQYDWGLGIAVDAAGQAYVTGETWSPDFPTVAAFQPAFGGGFSDAFVAKVTADGSALLYASFLGGYDYDWGRGIAVDAAGQAYVTGGTQSPDFPTVAAFQPSFGGGIWDAFVAKVAADGSTLLFASFLGGSNSDGGSGIAVDAAGQAYVTGGTDSPDFPTVAAFQPSFGGGYEDAFVAKVAADGRSLLYASFLGGSDWDWGVGIAVDTAGQAYVTGETDSADFPTVAAFQPAFGGGSGDAFVAKIGFEAVALPRIDALSPTFGPTGALVTISGAQFGDTQDASRVTFGATEAVVSSWSATQIEVTVPSLPAGSYDVVVTTSAGASNAVAFEVLFCNHTQTPPAARVMSSQSPQTLPTPRKDFDLRRHNRLPPQPPTAKQRSALAALQASRGKRLRIAWNPFNGTPHLLLNYAGYLSAPSHASPVAIARHFLETHAALFRLTHEDLDALHVGGVYTSKPNGVTYLTLTQSSHAIPVFQGQLRFTIDADGRIVSLSGNYYPGIRIPVTPVLSPTAALTIAARTTAPETPFVPQIWSGPTGPTQKTLFRKGPFTQTDAHHAASLVLFPMPGQFRLAWRVLFHKNSLERYLILVDANTGELLYRVNLVRFDEPQGLVFEVDPDDAPQVSASFGGDAMASPQGWLLQNDGVFFTLGGNNSCAQEDRDADDATPGYSPSSADGHYEYPFQNAYETTQGTDVDTDLDAAITNLFYQVNVIHDSFYHLGFDEAAGNFQHENFGQGGLGEDEVYADAQDGWGTGTEKLCKDRQGNPVRCRNDANFYTPPDGFNPAYGKPRMQMYLFTAPPLRNVDGDVDGDVIIHEYTHGVSTRLVGGAADVFGLFGVQSGAMGEGWGDWFAASLHEDPVLGEYVTGNATTGIRRYTLDNNPLTYGDLCQGPRGCEVHDDGEIWSATLWDLRRQFRDKYGNEAGRQRVEQLVIDAMKGAAANPSMLDMRDAILAADTKKENQDLIWRAFACRGMGLSATTTDHNDEHPVEAFDFPNGETCAVFKQGDLVRGQQTQFRVLGAAPGEQVFFLRSSRGVGSGPCLRLLGGLCLDLLKPVGLLGSAIADASGTATLRRTIPSRFPVGQEVSTQAVIRRGKGGADSVKTNTITATVQ